MAVGAGLRRPPVPGVTPRLVTLVAPAMGPDGQVARTPRRPVLAFYAKDVADEMAAHTALRPSPRKVAIGTCGGLAGRVFALFQSSHSSTFSR